MRVLRPHLATNPLSTAVLAASLVLVLPATQSAASDDAEALCMKAEERYVELFGEASDQAEGVAVVLMYKYRFCPAAITVKPGTTVRWVNVDKRTSHSVLVPDSGAPESDRVFSEEIIEMTFLSAGDHRYLCGPHWETHDMIGMVTVAE